MAKFKRTATTYVVFEHLKRVDDFRTMRQIVKETGETPNRVSAALHSLVRYKAVAFIEAPNTLHFYATPDTDTRSATREEVAPNQGQKRQRKKRDESKVTRRRVRE